MPPGRPGGFGLDVDEKVLREILEGVLDELAHLGAPEERLRPLRERLLALRVVALMRERREAPVYARPVFWTALALLLALFGALMGLPVHKLFP